MDEHEPGRIGLVWLGWSRDGVGGAKGFTEFGKNEEEGFGQLVLRDQLVGFPAEDVGGKNVEIEREMLDVAGVFLGGVFGRRRGEERAKDLLGFGDVFIGNGLRGEERRRRHDKTDGAKKSDPIAMEMQLVVLAHGRLVGFVLR